MNRPGLQVLVIAMLASCTCAAYAGDKWSFGVMADSQQTITGGENTVATDIIAAVNQQFIARNVDLVMQVGDLANDGSVAGLQTRLNANASLAANGIAFYGLRGNHDDNTAALTFFRNNYIPSSSPGVVVNVAPDATSYAVNYRNTTFVLLDILAVKGTTSAMDTATTWMNNLLSTDGHTQAFVLQHKNLLGQNHKDNAFGSSNDANSTQQNNFYRALQTNGVRYNISGHDHVNHRAICTSPDGQYKVQQIISQSDSTKFYTPQSPYSSREVSISDQQNMIGYYIYTVDGPRLTGEYWAVAPVGSTIPASPQWSLMDTFGYSLNGKQFTINRGASYTTVSDAIAAGNGYQGTAMAILAGVNTATATAAGSRPCADDLNTGWSERESGLISDVLHLWGMNNSLGSQVTDPFVLSISFTADVDPVDGDVYMVSRNAGGQWVNAVEGNVGGSSQYVSGAYHTGYGLGTYGVDPLTHTAWAVINHNSQFAVIPEPTHICLMVIGYLIAIHRARLPIGRP